MGTRRRIAAIAVTMCVSAVIGVTAAAAGTVGASFPVGFPSIVDASLGSPVLGFGAAGPVNRTPVILLHGNNDTPFATACNPYGEIHSLAQYLADHGYATSELWALGYQGAQCDTITTPTNKSGVAHSTVANIPDLDRFVTGGACLHGRQARRYRRAQPRSHARTGMDEGRPHGPPGQEARRDRRPEPRHHQLLTLTSQLLAGGRKRRLHAGQRGLSGVRLGGLAVPDLAESRRRDAWPDALPRHSQPRPRLRVLARAGRHPARRARRGQSGASTTTSLAARVSRGPRRSA